MFGANGNGTHDHPNSMHATHRATIISGTRISAQSPDSARLTGPVPTFVPVFELFVSVRLSGGMCVCLAVWRCLFRILLFCFFRFCMSVVSFVQSATASVSIRFCLFLSVGPYVCLCLAGCVCFLVVSFFQSGNLCLSVLSYGHLSRFLKIEIISI